MGLGIKHIHIPVTEEEFLEIEALKGREQSWREFALPRLRKNRSEKKVKKNCLPSASTLDKQRFGAQ